MFPFLFASLLLQAGAPPAVAVPPPPPPRVVLQVRMERRRERFEYYIENPSSIDDTGLVPHNIRQRYDAGNTWATLAATYRLFGGAAMTEVGLSPRVARAGSDIDTFFLASGDVATWGSRGVVRLRGVSLQQRIEMDHWRAWTLGLKFGYRRFSMDFLPSDRIITHTQPPSETREFLQIQETTWSHALETGASAWTSMTVRPRWQMDVLVEAVPLLRSRLGIRLPTKYPGQILRSDSFGLGARGRVSLERRGAHLAVGGAVTLHGAWGYRPSARYTERGLGADVSVTVRR